MNALEIKERRLFLQLTQKQLANLIGVSTQTINGYENGKEIPSTKHQILESVLKNNESNIINESSSTYQVLSPANTKISETIEKYNEVKTTARLAKEAGELDKANHYGYLSKLLQEQIEFLKKAKKITEKEKEILRRLDFEEEK